MIGLTREYRPDWSFTTVSCMDVDRPQWVRIAEVAVHYMGRPIFTKCYLRLIFFVHSLFEQEEEITILPSTGAVVL